MVEAASALGADIVQLALTLLPACRLLDLALSTALKGLARVKLSSTAFSASLVGTAWKSDSEALDSKAKPELRAAKENASLLTSSTPLLSLLSVRMPAEGKETAPRRVVCTIWVSWTWSGTTPAASETASRKRACSGAVKSAWPMDSFTATTTSTDGLQLSCELAPDIVKVPAGHAARPSCPPGQ
jgi:hypothetical protein